MGHCELPKPEPNSLFRPARKRGGALMLERSSIAVTRDLLFLPLPVIEVTIERNNFESRNPLPVPHSVSCNLRFRLRYLSIISKVITNRQVHDHQRFVLIRGKNWVNEDVLDIE